MSRAMSYVFFALFVGPFISQISFALNWPEPIKCSPQLEKVLSKFDFAPDAKWKKTDSISYANKAYKIQSKKIGHWVAFETNKDGVNLVTYESSTKHFYKFKNKDCKSSQKKTAQFKLYDEKKDSKSKPFTDQDLAKLVGKNKKGLIYMWSPKMVYSVALFEQYADLAKKNKFEFTAVLANDVSFNEADTALKTIKEKFNDRKLASTESLLKLASVDLYMRDATLHYPAVIVYNNGKIQSKRIVGVNTPVDFENMINQFATELK